METKLTTQESPDLLNFNDEQLKLIKTQIAKDATNDELQLFLYQCRRTGLNPLSKQIYFIKRGGKMTIQTAIDGFRVIAERSGTYAGQDEPKWEDDEKGVPIKCTVTVYRFHPISAVRYPAGVGVAYFKEYYPTPVLLQKSMPHTMISKVAEALALRKAFPQDLSGLYTADEMEQATPLENGEHKETAKPVANLSDELAHAVLTCATESQLKQLWSANSFLHKNTQFKAAVNKQKAKLSPNLTELAKPEHNIVQEVKETEKKQTIYEVPESEQPLQWLSEDEFRRSMNRITEGNVEELPRLQAQFKIKKVHLEALTEAHSFSLKLA